MLASWRARSRDPRKAPLLSVSDLRWIAAHRAWTPWYLRRYLRFVLFRLRNPHIVTTGMVFLGRNVEVVARAGYGRLILGRFVHIGDGTSIRCHEGTVRIGDKVVFGRNSVVNGYLDVAIGAATIVADMVYVSDFDHVFTDAEMPIKDQGIAKAPVRIGDDVWLGTKVTVTRGVRIGDGSVIGANAVVTNDLPEFSVAVGAPARVVRDRRTGAAPAEAAPAEAATRGTLAHVARNLRDDGARSAEREESR